MNITQERLIQDLVKAAREYMFDLDEVADLAHARVAYAPVRAALERLDRVEDKKVGRFCDECGRRRMTVKGVETLHKADCPRAARAT